jgi:hypothetical protein
MVPAPTPELQHSPGGEVRRCTLDRKLGLSQKVSTTEAGGERNRLRSSLTAKPILKLQRSPRGEHLMCSTSLKRISNLYSVN